MYTPFVLLCLFDFVMAWAPLLEDNTAILDVPGEPNPNPNGWHDSYSVGDSCYCESTFDHNIGGILVETPFGTKTVLEVCNLLGSPPEGSTNRPRYNDIQCGHGPPNDAGDEDTCPGRVEYGSEGCKYIGPKWNFSNLNGIVPTQTPIVVNQNPTIETTTTTSLYIDWKGTGDGVNYDLDRPQNSWTHSDTAVSIENVPSGYTDEVFQHHRSSKSLVYKAYGFQPGSMQQLSFGFSEIYEPNCAVGKRIMDVTVNGVVVASNLDVFAASSCNAAYFATTVQPADEDGRYEMQIVASVENAMISVITIDEVSSDALPPIESPTPLPVAPLTVAPTTSPITMSPITSPSSFPSSSPLASTNNPISLFPTIQSTLSNLTLTPAPNTTALPTLSPTNTTTVPTFSPTWNATTSPSGYPTLSLLPTQYPTLSLLPTQTNRSTSMDNSSPLQDSPIVTSGCSTVVVWCLKFFLVSTMFVSIV